MNMKPQRKRLALVLNLLLFMPLVPLTIGARLSFASSDSNGEGSGNPHSGRKVARDLDADVNDFQFGRKSDRIVSLIVQMSENKSQSSDGELESKFRGHN